MLMVSKILRMTFYINVGGAFYGGDCSCLILRVFFQFSLVNLFSYCHQSLFSGFLSLHSSFFSLFSVVVTLQCSLCSISLCSLFIVSFVLSRRGLFLWPSISQKPKSFHPFLSISLVSHGILCYYYLLVCLHRSYDL